MTEQLTIDRGLEAQASPSELMAAAFAWILANRQAWDFMVGAAQRDALDQVPIRVKGYVEHLRDRRDVTWATESVKLPNAFTPAFNRLLAAWHPETAPYIRTASSKLNGVAIPPRPY